MNSGIEEPSLLQGIDLADQSKAETLSIKERNRHAG